MGIQEEVTSAITDICSVSWSERTGTVVPSTDTIVMRNGAVNVDATYLYADLADSTGLAHKVNHKVAARVIRAYLHSSAKIIKKYGGEIRSYDGDRVMGIFMGTSKNSNAGRAALGINWAFCEVLKPTLTAKWPKLKDLWVAGHGVGIATGEAMIVRGGVVGSNDLLSVGKAPNIAAKLSEIRSAKSIYATYAAYSSMNAGAKKAQDNKDMWGVYADQTFGGETLKVWASTYWKKP